MTPRPGDEVSASADRPMEVAIGRLLQTGVSLAAAMVLLGGVLYLRRNADVPVSYGTFHGEAADLRQLGPVLRGAVHGDAAAVIQVGVLLLIATPVARVVFAAVAFARERDRLYVGISLVVLAVLLVGLLHGF